MTAPLLGAGATFESLDEAYEREAREQHDALMASGAAGISLLPVYDERSLMAMVRHADANPPTRWYPIKIAGARGWLHLLPAWPELTEFTINCERASFSLVDAADVPGGHLPAVSPERAAEVHRLLQTPVPEDPR